MPRLRGSTPQPPHGGRTAGQAAAVFAVAMAAGLLVESLVPPRWTVGTGTGGQTPFDARPPGGAGGRQTEKGDEAVTFRDQLDVSAPQEELSRAVVLRVDAARPDLWRTQTFDSWDGRVWRESQDVVERSIPGLGVRHALPPPVPPSSTSEDDTFPTFSQHFTVEARYVDVLATAPEAQSVGLDSVILNTLGTIRPEQPLGRGATYAVESLRLDAEPDALRELGSDPVATRGPTALPAYLQLPPGSGRVSDLAGEITAGAATTYDKAAAVEAWLRENVRIVDSGPARADVVETVLFGDRTATRTQVATAMAVLLRSVRVPARLAVGFLPGQRGLFGGEFVVRARDRHAWVEVGFGYTWQRFDPSGLLARAEREDSLVARFLRLLRQLAPFLVLATAAAAAAVGWWLLERRRRRRALPWVSRYWADLVKAGAGAGRPRQPAETPAEYAEALAGSALPDDRLVRVGGIVTAAAYSGREPPPEARSWSEDVLGEAVAARRRARRRLRRRTPAPS